MTYSTVVLYLEDEFLLTISLFTNCLSKTDFVAWFSLFKYSFSAIHLCN